MDFRDKNPTDAPPAARTPKEPSSLSGWANLHGTRHRDFSPLHRESRNPSRHRADSFEDEQPVITSAAVKALEIGVPGIPEESSFRPSRETDSAPRVNGIERRKGVRRAEDAISAEAMAGRQRRQVVDPAQRQDARDAEFDLRRRQATVAQAPLRGVEAIAGAGSLYREPGYETLPPSHSASVDRAEPEHDSVREATAPDAFDALSEPLASPDSCRPDPIGPAWLYAPPTPPIAAKPLGPLPLSPPVSVAETLQASRERVASRWFALKGVFAQREDPAAAASPRQKETHTPVLAVYSLAGGVGKTSLVATAGRSLSAMGEKVLLTDTTSHGLLPFYFGANELQHDTVRTFSPPSGSTDAPIYLVSHRMEERAAEESARQRFVEEVMTNSQGMHRILLDLSASSSWVIRQMARMNLTVLIPVAPDMNSVISLSFVEKFFSELIDRDARPLQPFYLLNQFDPSLPLHLDVREVLRKKLGDRLLPFVIRRAPEVSEALAEGMTVVDYAPETPIAEDYIQIATWLRTVAAPAAAGFRSVRWTES